MKSKLLAGTATLALSVALASHPASAATLDDVLHRLDKLEKENAELRKEVAQPGPVPGGASRELLAAHGVAPVFMRGSSRP